EEDLGHGTSSLRPRSVLTRRSPAALGRRSPLVLGAGPFASPLLFLLPDQEQAADVAHEPRLVLGAERSRRVLAVPERLADPLVSLPDVVAQRLVAPPLLGDA